MSKDKLKFDGHFAVIPNHILRDESLSMEARGFLAMVISMAEDWKFYRSKMMQLSKCGKAKYNRILTELKDAGYLTITDNRAENGTFGGKTWHVHNMGEAPRPEKRAAVKRAAVEPTVENTDGGENGSHKNTNLNKNTNLEEIKNTKKDLSSLHSEFDGVWEYYPRKVGKGSAVSAWVKARKSYSFEDIAKPLGQFIRLQAGADKQFIPHLATWLNQERWNDDQTHATNRAQTTDDQLDGLMAPKSSDDELNNLFPSERKLLQ